MGVRTHITTYSPYGEPLQLSLGNTIGKFSWQTIEYDDGTRRLARSRLTREGVASDDADTAYR